MDDIKLWISSTAFPALGSCWDFFKKSIADLISVVTSSRLVFIFALFLIGTIISVIVFIATSTPDVSNVDTSYPEFKLIRHKDLYFSAFSRPFTLNLFAKFKSFLHRKRKQKENDVIYGYSKSIADEYFENHPNAVSLSYNGFRFFAPDFQKRKGKVVDAELYEKSKALADEFFENNQGRMTLSINGFKFFAPNFEKRSWGNNTKSRKTVKYDSHGNVLRTSYTSTQTVDETTEMEQTNY